MSDSVLKRVNLGLELIQDADLPYEHQILEDPDNLTNWLRYFWHKDSTTEKLFILQRACDHLKRSYKLWIMYLDMRIELVQDLNPIEHKQEFLDVNNEFEKSLYLLNKMPMLWVKYLQFLLLQEDVTFIRRKFTEALRMLPVTQHQKIWPLYLEFADSVGGLTGSKIYLKYLIFNPDDIELVLNRLIQFKDIKNSITVFEKVLNDENFVSKEGKSPLELWLEYADILMSTKKADQNHDTIVENFVRNGIERFPDQQGKLYVKLATYFSKRGAYEKARALLEEGLELVLTVKDFTVIYDSYAEFEESSINKLVELISSKEEAGEDIDELNLELDLQLARFEKLMDKRPFLLSDVKLRQNPNNVEEWLHRISLFNPENLSDILQTYVKAITTIEPFKATEGLSTIWINYSKVYEENNDLSTARTILDKAVKVPFNSPDELVNIWLEWSELELRQDDIEKAIKVLEVATKSPKISKIDYWDSSIAVQGRIHKSIKLWSFYLDLVESSGDIEETCSIYDRVFELKIATPLTVINYANFLEENNRFEEAFKIYERGVNIFKFPVVFEIWNIYLTKALKRNLNIERLRDLFEHALSECPSDLSKPIYLLYSKLEEDNGLIQRSLKLLNKAVDSVKLDDKPEVLNVLIAKTIEHSGLTSTRPILTRAIDELPLKYAIAFVIRFADIEIKLNEFERARELLKYGALQQSPIKNTKLWEFWSDFEVAHGNKETYKAMLRIKRQATEEFNTDILNSSEPVGFVKSSEGPKVSSINASAPTAQANEINPDAIDLDI
ncbi:hypothetical protein WICANDRAFT_34359 [Wickerhamomyces anomalus NRRL Y-366-8]|uniref:Pre-mRNA-splicing factor SYF1 n=1 Tax=Wickerhamomyces anomalus (strain ATCC 58044 / CBS 1984 / NCYC 433 / NRRL Y-366-8) TaxID=683960 RepID=A0A1E3NYB7_WICAA|nr:uncharacterized protein WICANDRAFT_34359 [Wickerhamomyces anomalus NRRL Y-366-8]ODQ58199.1 hypothetical protein WICANDRAFT_34359 [Wickerhamomyces anomalus NRRL Y-366-8]